MVVERNPNIEFKLIRLGNFRVLIDKIIKLIKLLVQNFR